MSRTISEENAALKDPNRKAEPGGHGAQHIELGHADEEQNARGDRQGEDDSDKRRLIGFPGDEKREPRGQGHKGQLEEDLPAQPGMLEIIQDEDGAQRPSEVKEGDRGSQAEHSDDGGEERIGQVPAVPSAGGFRAD